LVSLATEVANAMLPYYKQMMPAGVQFVEVFAKDIGALFRQEGTYVFPSGTVGTRTGADADRSNAAASLVLRSGYAGRRNHGRKSISCFSEQDISGDNLLGQLGAYLGSLAATWLVNRVSNYFFPGIGSQVAGTVRRIQQVVAPDGFVDSQKTRLPKHGR